MKSRTELLNIRNREVLTVAIDAFNEAFNAATPEERKHFKKIMPVLNAAVADKNVELVEAMIDCPDLPTLAAACEKYSDFMASVLTETVAANARVEKLALRTAKKSGTKKPVAPAKRKKVVAQPYKYTASDFKLVVEFYHLDPAMYGYPKMPAYTKHYDRVANEMVKRGFVNDEELCFTDTAKSTAASQIWDHLEKINLRQLGTRVLGKTKTDRLHCEYAAAFLLAPLTDEQKFMLEDYYDEFIQFRKNPSKAELIEIENLRAPLRKALMLQKTNGDFQRTPFGNTCRLYFAILSQL